MATAEQLRAWGLLPPQSAPTGAYQGMQPPGNPQVLPVGDQSPRNRRQNPAAGKMPIFDNHHYTRLGGAQVWNLAAGVSTLVLPAASSLRNMLMFRNASTLDSGATIYIEFGKASSTLGQLELLCGETSPGRVADQVLYDVGVPQDDIYAFSSIAAVLVLSCGFPMTP